MFSTPAGASQWVRDCSRAYDGMRNYIGRQIGVNRCMFTGKHWITEDMLYGYMNEMGRHLSNYNINSNKLRVVKNRIPRFIHEVAAATFPEKLDYAVSPPDRDVGSEAAIRTHVLESTLNEAIESSGMLECAREANYRRCIDGMYGIGLSIRKESRGGETDNLLKAFTFEASRLILDPFNQNLDLHDHEYVIYRDVWTITKIQRELGLKLDPDDLKTVGQLMPMEVAMNRLSQNRLYTYLREFSTTKGAVVYQVHVKDPVSNRFPTMLIGVEPSDKEINWINFDNQESPFGGNGMPLMLLHGYREADNMVSQSDVAQLKGIQDEINLYGSMMARMMQKNAGFQWLIPQGSMIGDGPDDYKSQFNNYVGGLIEYKAGTRERPMAPPQLVQYPMPQPFLQDAISLYQERDMPSQIHRASITQGTTKSHVPDSTFQSALQQAGQVLGNRQREDMARYESFASVLLGTNVKLAQAGSPATLVQLRRSGFDETDFAMLSQADPYYPACEIRLVESSIRYRSTEQKEEKLNTAAQLQMITPAQYRQAAADLDAPLTDEDRVYSTAAKKSALRVMLGEQWIPRSLGQATEFFLKEFRQAMFDRRAEQDPSAMQRLGVAVQQMMAYANAEMAQQVAAENPQPQPVVGQGQPEPGQDQPQAVSMADVISQLNMGNQQQESAA